MFSTASSDWYGGELRLLATPWKQHKLMLGLEHQMNSRHEQTLEDLTDPENKVVIPGSGSRQGAYAQDEWAISQSLTATLGLRVDRNNVTGTKRSPRAGLIWQATPATNIKALYGRAHRAPNALERDYDDEISQVANHKLNGETIDTLELVVDHRIGRNLLLRGSVYQWKMVGLVVLGMETVSDLAQYQSGEDVKSRGFELSADKTMHWGGRLRGSLTYQSTQFASGGDLPNSPHVMGKVNFSSPLANTGLFMGYEFQYYSKRETVVKGAYAGGYALSNLNLLTDKWFKGTEVSLGVYNLFNKHYAHPGADTNWQNALEQDGRQVRLKAVYTF
ncbi:MAG: TonB-dependent receptor [Betaproteobacteria bacterium]|nr:TonB-dependent receptor [Betaproteobacteria bacterium]